MPSKSLIFPLFLAITFHGLSMQTTSQAIDVGGKPVMVHITNVVATNNMPLVELNIQDQGGHDMLPSVSLSRGQEYQLKAMENNSYTAMASLGMEFVAVDTYLPERDKGQAAVYWRVNDVGFYIGYDGSKWKLDTRWESE